MASLYAWIPSSRISPIFLFLHFFPRHHANYAVCDVGEEGGVFFFPFPFQSPYSGRIEVLRVFPLSYSIVMSFVFYLLNSLRLSFKFLYSIQLPTSTSDEVFAEEKYSNQILYKI